MVIFKYVNLMTPRVDPNSFTFQYGDIQITVQARLHVAFLDLHSNMVIFKCTSGGDDKPTTLAFTFQYGDIQI